MFRTIQEAIDNAVARIDINDPAAVQETIDTLTRRNVLFSDANERPQTSAETKIARQNIITENRAVIDHLLSLQLASTR